MALLYTGIDREGNLRKGKVDIQDKATAYKVLLAQGIKPISIEEEKKFWHKEIIKRKPSEDELSFTLLQLSLLLSSGLNLNKALEVLSKQVDNKTIMSALNSVRESIERGEAIYYAFKKTEVFPDFLVEMLRIAERGENLEEIFRMAGEFLQRMSQVRSKVISSLTYPAFVIMLSFISVIVVIKFVVPKIASVLVSFGKDLPLATKILLFVSKIVSYFFYLLPALLVVLLFSRGVVSKEKLDMIFLKVPIFGKVSYLFNLSRFAGSLRMSLLSGIPLVKALTLSRGSITNHYLRKRLEGIEEELSKGMSLSEVLRKTGVFPTLFINLISSGEKGGQLDRMLFLIEEFYDRQAMRVISFWIRFAEPISMLIIGVLVAFIVLSVILPITELSTGIRR
ncbi:type II secretion system F family protein [Hydrogenobacter hydrogenophilus]|uniref:Type IV pilus assembly protein PilC n=1 Tax=Hydrogenobacter hydrogenophilus TaxID=35835 RepID=A0A285P054_9AQUI|nr:type II secretion system F family protein [Hydrogenobacter hydrogenophilus]SNZ15124.1 type IV pilus assembly protein PilC [Hydrogenobacter hydrogenophilus]